MCAAPWHEILGTFLPLLIVLVAADAFDERANFKLFGSSPADTFNGKYAV